MEGHAKPLALERSLTDLAPALTVAPGRGPFHVKGLVIQGLFEYVTQMVPGGPARVIEAIPDPAIREYVQQPFLAASRYDFLPYLHAVVAAATLSGTPIPRFVAEHCAWQAERDVRGVYRLLLKLASPELVAQRLGVAWSRYFDFARTEVLSVTPGCAVLSVRAMPAILVPWYRVAVRAAGDKIISLAGARDIKVAFSYPEPDGEVKGFALRKYEVRRTWTR